MNLLKSAALAMVGATGPRADREPLKAALAGRAVKQQAVADAQAKLARFEEIGSIDHDAARAKANAISKAGEMRQAWVFGGCPLSGTAALQSADQQAEELSRAAASAALNTQAVGGELRRARIAVEDAKSALDQVEHDIKDQIGIIIAHEEAPLLERFVRIAAEYRSLRAQLMGLQLIVDPWQRQRDAAPSAEGQRLLVDALNRGRIQTFEQERDAARVDARYNESATDRDGEMYEQYAARLRQRAQALRVDPES